jgi:hypothetical protein
MKKLTAPSALNGVVVLYELTLAVVAGFSGFLPLSLLMFFFL